MGTRYIDERRAKAAVYVRGMLRQDTPNRVAKALGLARVTTLSVAAEVATEDSTIDTVLAHMDAARGAAE